MPANTLIYRNKLAKLRMYQIFYGFYTTLMELELYTRISATASVVKEPHNTELMKQKIILETNKTVVFLILIRNRDDQD